MTSCVYLDPFHLTVYYRIKPLSITSFTIPHLKKDITLSTCPYAFNVAIKS